LDGLKVAAAAEGGVAPELGLAAAMQT